MIPVPLQFHTFLVTSLTGVALAFLLDLGRVARHLTHPRGLTAHGGDVVLWALGAAIAAAGLYVGSWGEVRYYALVAGGLGIAAYFALASSTVLWALERILRRMAAAWRAVVTRLRRMARALGRMARALGRAARALRRALAFAGGSLSRLFRAMTWLTRLPGRLWRKLFRPPGGGGG